MRKTAAEYIDKYNFYNLAVPSKDKKKKKNPYQQAQNKGLHFLPLIADNNLGRVES